LGEVNRAKRNKDMKTIKTKKLLIEQLKKTPIIQVACEKTGIGRATYYRWKKEDEEFSAKADEALSEGSSLVSDIAESQLMSAIKDKNLTAIIFWLKHHHPAYATKVEVNARLRADNEVLTPEQEVLVTRALKLASLLPDVKELEEETK
jgi:ABC-type Fe3+ transport system substrate-binding protein